MVGFGLGLGFSDRPARGVGRPIPWQVLLTAADWDGSALVGKGVSLAPVSGSDAPVLSGGNLVFAGSSRLTGALSVDLTGCAVIAAVRVTSTTATTAQPPSKGAAMAHISTRRKRWRFTTGVSDTRDS